MFFLHQFYILKKILCFIIMCFSFASYGSECEKAFSIENNQNPSELSLGGTFKGLGLTLMNAVTTPSYFLDTIRAKRGNSNAQYKIGLRYYLGDGVEKDDEKAIYWTEKSANQGHPPAQRLLGLLFKDKQDFEKAAFWIRKYAGSQGHNESKLDLEDLEYRLSILNTMYRLVRVDKGDKQAVSLLEQSAHQGNRSAQYLLSIMYNVGVGVEENLVQAYRWSLSAKHNDQEIPESDLPLLHIQKQSELIEDIEMMVNDTADALTQNQIAETKKQINELKSQQ